MSYTPTTWATGDTITAALLNKMEQGIKDNADAAAAAIEAPSFPTDGQFLVYNTTAGKWVAQTVPAASGVSF